MRRIQTGRLIALLIMVAGISTAGVSLHGLIERTYALGGPDELDVPYVPTPESVVEKMLDMAAVTGSDLVYDLGCGDGRIVIAAAKERGARGVGIDLDPERIRESKENAREARVTDRVMFVRQDLYNTDLRDATVVTLYLLPSVNLEIRPKLFKELKPGTRVVSHDFDMGEWTADQIAEVDGSMVYFWVMPANVSGTWKWTMPGSAGKERFVLKLEQEFQNARGTLTSGSSEMPVHDVRISGDQVSFTVDQAAGGKAAGVRYEGRVNGDTIQGVIHNPDGQSEGKGWTARRDPSTVVPIDNSDEIPL